MTKYNGHKNWNHWNVSLWINNDYNLYEQARWLVSHCLNRQEAAKAMLQWLSNMGEKKTPDGAPYSVSSIRAAMLEM